MGIVRHLEAFPDDGLQVAIENTFSFDKYDSQVRVSACFPFHVCACE